MALAITTRNDINQKVASLRKQNTNTQKDIELLDQNKKSLSTMFKSKNDINSLENQINTRESEIDY